MPARLRPDRLLPGSLRSRITAAAVVVVAAILAVVGLSLVAALRWSLTGDVLAAAKLRAQDVANVLHAGSPAAGLAVEDPEDVFIQVLDGRGRVVASSPNVRGAPPVADLEPGATATISDPPVDDDPFVVVAVAAATPDGPATVVVGRTLETISDATTVLTRAMLVGLPLALALLGAAAWHLVGRALAPVEAIRGEVDAVTAADLSRRVPAPASDDEIGRLAHTMNRMLARLEDAQARQRRFVSDASHELRSPIATLSQHADVALRHPEQVSKRELAGVVLAESTRLHRLVSDLLWLVRADESALRTVRRPVDLDDLVIDEARRLATSGMRVDTARVSAGQVNGDAGQLRHLLRNLTDNASRHARSQVALAVSEGPEGVVLHVDDDGPGIPQADRQRVLERFVRLDDARARDSGGSGLGLAIVAEIAAAHGGAVAVEDSPLGGARIEVVLPRAAGPLRAFRSGSAAQPYRHGRSEEPAGGRA